jgi:hypothetical protein
MQKATHKSECLSVMVRIIVGNVVLIHVFVIVLT